MGEILEEVKIVTFGGTVDNLNHSWTHLLDLKVNEYGIFFLHPNSKISNTYSVVGSAQGFLKFSKARGGLVVQNVQSKYSNLQRDVYEKIRQYSNQNIQYIFDKHESGILNDECVNIEIEQLPINRIVQNVSSFGLNISKDREPKKLNSINFRMRYNSEIWGENIIDSGFINFSYGSQLSTSSYTLIASDLTNTEFQVSIVAKEGSPLLIVDQFEKQFLFFNMHLPNDIGLADFNPSNITFTYELSIADNSSVEIFDCFNFEVRNEINCIDITRIEVLNDELEVIPNVSKIAGGVQGMALNGVPAILRIIAEEGGFGIGPTNFTKPLDSDVLFTDAESLNWFKTPSLDYKSWTDNEITIRVPTRQEDTNRLQFFMDLFVASSGEIEV